MYFALVNFPDIKHESFHRFRNRYDPYASLIREHLSFIFPVPSSIGKQVFINHIEKVLETWQPFDVTISGFFKTIDQWLMLSIKDGNDNVIALHDDFYKGVLQSYCRKDLPFTPHVGLGFFGKKAYDFHNPTAVISLDEEKYSLALAEISEEELIFRKTVDSLTMLELNDDFSECDEVKTFII